MRIAISMMLASVALAACHGSSPQLGPVPGYAPERDIDRATVLLSSWRPSSPQRCGVALTPAVLPPVDALIATQSVPLLLEQGGIASARGSALLSLKFDSTGAPTRVRVIEGTVSDSTARVLEQVVLSALEQQHAGPPWGVRLRIDLDSAPRYRVGRAEHCPAARLPEHEGAPAGPTAGPFGASPANSRTIQYSAKFAIGVDADGHVTEVRTIDPGTTDASTVEGMKQSIRAWRYAPERDDGVAVATVVQATHRIILTIVGPTR